MPSKEQISEQSHLLTCYVSTYSVCVRACRPQRAWDLVNQPCRLLRRLGCWKYVAFWYVLQHYQDIKIANLWSSEEHWQGKHGVS